MFQEAHCVKKDKDMQQTHNSKGNTDIVEVWLNDMTKRPVSLKWVCDLRRFRTAWNIWASVVFTHFSASSHSSDHVSKNSWHLTPWSSDSSVKEQHLDIGLVHFFFKRNHVLLSSQPTVPVWIHNFTSHETTADRWHMPTGARQTSRFSRSR